ncbi:MAG: EamA family transporter [Oscillospiraceae bacterium]|nr:EamA family transporter [Oscillospiraceae bacterium]
MVNNQVKGTIYMLLCALCWSFSGLLVKVIPWSPFAVTGLRCFFGLLVTLLVVRDRRVRLTKQNFLTAACVLLTAASYIVAIRMTTAANAIVLQYTAPILILIYQILFQKKRATRLDLIAVTVILSGIVLFFVEGIAGGSVWGNLVALSSGVFFSGVFLCNARPGATPMQSNILAYIMGSIIFLPSIVTNVTPDPLAWGAAVVLGAVTLGLAYFFFAKGSQHISALAGSLITCIEPILSPLWVGLVVGEIPSAWGFGGMALVILGVVGYNVMLIRKSQN